MMNPMDRAEALQVAGAVLDRLRRRPYDRLVAELLREPQTEEITGPSGAAYQVEVEAIWDDRKKRHLRVMVAIDDGGWRAFAPLSTDFIVAPDGSFVGE
jgi:hypothetical protein